MDAAVFCNRISKTRVRKKPELHAKTEIVFPPFDEFENRFRSCRPIRVDRRLIADLPVCIEISNVDFSR